MKLHKKCLQNYFKLCRYFFMLYIAILTAISIV